MDTDLVIDTSTVIAVIANEPEKPLLIAKTRGYDLTSTAFALLGNRQRIFGDD